MVILNKRKIFKLVLAVVAIIQCSAVSAGNEPVNMVMNPVTGSTLKYREYNKQLQLVNGDTTITTQTTFSTWHFPARKGDTILAEWTSMRVIYEKKSAFQSFLVDTDEPATENEGNLFHTIFNSMIGKKLTLKMSASGQIYDILGTEEMMDSVLQAAVSRTPEKAEEMKKMISGMVNKSSFMTNLQRIFNFYPSKPVKPGSKWKNKSKSKAGFMNISSDTRFQLAESTTDGMVVKQTGVSVIKGQNNMEYSGMKFLMEMDMKTTSTGKSVISTQTYWVKSMSVETLLTGKVNSTINGKKTSSLQTIVSVSKMEMID